MLRVGLTGGIASGKSFVASELRRLGVPVVDADRLARLVVEPHREAFREIVERFGPEVVGPEGCLDREALGRIVFSDESARVELEAMTHPRIAAEAEAWLQEQEEAGAKLAVYEAPLIYEAGLDEYFDVVVVVAVGRSTQLRRLIRRNGISEAAARRRLDAQMSTAEKVRRAHHVIGNDGTLDELRAQVSRLYEVLRDAATQKVGPSR